MAESDKFFAMSFNQFRTVQAEEAPIVLQLRDPPPPCIPQQRLPVQIFSPEVDDGEVAVASEDVTEGEEAMADGGASGSEEDVPNEDEDSDDEATRMGDSILGKLLQDRMGSGASGSASFSPILVPASRSRSSPRTPPKAPTIVAATSKRLSTPVQPSATPMPPPRLSTSAMQAVPPSVPPAVHPPKPQPALRVPVQPPSPPPARRALAEQWHHSTTWSTAPPQVKVATPVPTPPPPPLSRSATASSAAAGSSSMPHAKQHRLEELVDDTEGSSSSTGLGKCGPWRPGIHGGRARFGSSGGTHREYYKGFYKAKGQGKAALDAYVAWMGPPPSQW
jgi:hypothetical protein